MRARTPSVAAIALAIALVALGAWRAACVLAGPDVDTDAYAHHMIARAILADPHDLAVHWVWLPLFHYLQVPLVALGGTMTDVRWVNVILAAAVSYTHLFLHAVVGPVGIVRARCDPRSPPQGCVPLPLRPLPEAVCAYDPTGLPTPAEPLDPAFTCRPDPAHGVACAPTVQLVIPVKLGPRTSLWDVAFTGVKTQSELQVADSAKLPLGEPVNTTKLEDARRRIVDWYKERCV